MADVVRVRLVCGCGFVLTGEHREPPYCAEHDERRVGHVSAPPPRFTAVNCDVRGPHVRTH